MTEKLKDELLHDHNHDGVNRRGFLKCMAWAGTGALCVMQGGVLKSYSIDSPASMTIHKGTTITWKNNDGFVHTSTADGGLWNTGDIAGGASKTTTFDSVGTFTYNCIYHRSMGMVGTIKVQ